MFVLDDFPVNNFVRSISVGTGLKEGASESVVVVTVSQLQLILQPQARTQ